jgi:hypothetical protein
MPALSQSLIFHTNSGTNTVLVNYPNTGTGSLTYFSDKVKGDGYFGGSDGFHTVSYNTTQHFRGTVTMQATLVSEPISSDWFNVADTSQVYRQFDVRTGPSVDIFNFTGNFVWVRGYIQIEEGSVTAIQYNH